MHWANHYTSHYTNGTTQMSHLNRTRPALHLKLTGKVLDICSIIQLRKSQKVNSVDLDVFNERNISQLIQETSLVKKSIIVQKRMPAFTFWTEKADGLRSE